MNLVFPCLITLAAANFVFAQRANPGPKPGPVPAMEAELKQLIPITTAVREDDHPAVASRGGDISVAWVSYSETEGSNRIFLRTFHNGKWAEPTEIGEGPGDYHKPAITVEENGTVWVVWPAQVRGNWDIYGRAQRSGTWDKIERLTKDLGSDMAPQLAAARGNVLLVWQGMRGSSFDILYRLHGSAGWGAEGFVTHDAANDWEPVVAASPTGDFHVAWDSYRGDYDVFLRTLSNGRWGAEIAVANSARLENHASLTVDLRGRLWIAWETGPENWASDSAEGGLRPRRDIGIACWRDGKLYHAPEAIAALEAVAGKTGMQAPAISFDPDGRMRLFFRRPANLNWLDVETTVWDGTAWSKPDRFTYSEGRIDQRIVLARTADRVLACFPAGSSHSTIYGRFFGAETVASPGAAPVLTAAPLISAKPAPVARTPHMLSGYRLVWGDLHRHTDISEDGGLTDGSLLDTMRYALDAAGLDFLGITDHTRYLPRRYNLWRIQQTTDLFYKPGVFSSMHAYERSQYSPWGHRNVVHLDRDYVPVPASYDTGDPGVDPNGLWAALRGKRAITIPHTPAWGNKQVSWDYNDPDIERLVEIYQGLRSTYEYNGAPDRAGQAVYEKNSKYFVWNALERKLKLGFIASSDHRSTHVSFAAVYAKTLDRPGVFDGLRSRRTYAATDKILVDFTIAGHLMGEEIELSGKPELQVSIEGTGPIAQVDVIKNNRFVYTVKPGVAKSQFTFRDQEATEGEAYYYVRVIQADKNMAWASPIWVRFR